jgi:hypothetical protein
MAAKTAARRGSSWRSAGSPSRQPAAKAKAASALSLAASYRQLWHRNVCLWLRRQAAPAGGENKQLLFRQRSVSGYRGENQQSNEQKRGRRKAYRKISGWRKMKSYRSAGVLGQRRQRNEEINNVGVWL